MKNMMVAMKVLWGCLVCAIISNFMPISANAKAVEVRSENFVFVGDVRENDAKKLVMELEAYRAGVLQLMGVTAGPERIPVRIYSAKNERILKEMTGLSGIAGVYKTTLDGPVFILNSKGGFRRGKEARHIALHEYTHHLLATYTNVYYPLWYNEGLANYYSTFEVNKKGHLLVGRPYQPYGYPLSAKQWLPTEMVVGSVMNYPFASYEVPSGYIGPADFFYAQSWLAVHYIQSNEAAMAKMRTYVGLLNTAPRIDNTFTQAFQQTPAQFHATLQAYYRANKYEIKTIDVDKNVTPKPVNARVLSKGEAQFHKAEAMRFFSGSSVTTAQIVAQYDEASELLGETSHILSARADLASWENDYEKAEAYIKQAMILTPKSPILNRTAGMIYLYKNGTEAATLNLAEIKRARKYLRQAIHYNPDDISAHYYYAKTYDLVNGKPAQSAVDSAEIALDYYQSVDFVSTNLDMASVLVEAGQGEIAEETINKGLVWGMNSGVRRRAVDLRNQLTRQTNGN